MEEFVIPERCPVAAYGIERRGKAEVAAVRGGNARPDGVARKPCPDEHDEPVEPRDPVPAVGQRVDMELELLVALHRRSHGYRSAVT